MATLSDWNAYLGVLHDLALVEDDLREQVRGVVGNDEFLDGKSHLAEVILYERFGVDL